MDWWLARNDVADANAKLYYYVGMEGSRWKLEGSTYSFWAPDTIRFICHTTRNFTLLFRYKFVNVQVCTNINYFTKHETINPDHFPRRA